MGAKFEKIIKEIPCPGWYPPWTTISAASLFFGVGRDTITAWVKAGVVLERKKGCTSRQVRCEDIYRVMEDEALSRTSKQVAFATPKRRMRRRPGAAV